MPMPHFLLTAGGKTRGSTGNWQFALERDGARQIEVEDVEPLAQGQRVELLAVVRGLEALDQPSRVTLVTASSYVKRGLNYGLEDWRASGWCWEAHGKMVPVKNGDLWRRLDRALQYHKIECRLQPSAAAEPRPLAKCVLQKPKDESETTQVTVTATTRRRRLLPAARRWFREARGSIRLRLAQFGTGLLPHPWLE